MKPLAKQREIPAGLFGTDTEQSSSLLLGWGSASSVGGDAAGRAPRAIPCEGKAGMQRQGRGRAGKRGLFPLKTSRAHISRGESAKRATAVSRPGVTHASAHAALGAGVSHRSPRRVFVLAPCPCPRHSRAVPVPGTAGQLTRGAGASPAAPVAQRGPVPGARDAEVPGMDAGVLGRSHSDLQRPGLLPASSRRCRSTSPACPSAGGAMSPRPRGWRGGERGSALARWGQEGVCPRWSAEGWRSQLAAWAGGCSGQPWPCGAGTGGRAGATATFPSPQWDLGVCSVSSAAPRGGRAGKEGRAGGRCSPARSSF